MIGEFSDILGKLYDASFDTNKWKPILADLTNLFDSDCAHLTGSIWPQEVVLSVLHGVSDSLLEDYAEYFFSAEDDPRPIYAFENPSKPFHWGMLPNLDAFRRSPLYTKVMEPNGCHDQLITLVPIDRSLYGVTHMSIGLWRDRSRGPYCQSDCDLLSEFVPHLKRVFELQRLFVTAQFSANPAVELLDEFPIGIMLCDSGGHVQLANCAARSIASGDEGLMIRHSQLWAEDSVVTERLRGHIRRAIVDPDTDQAVQPVTMSIERSSGGSPLLVMISGLASATAHLGLSAFRQPVAVVFVSDPDQQQETSEELLQRLFGLTGAEAQLLRSLVNGASLAEAAQSGEIAESTARGYLKQIFAKTNTSGQADLIRLISNSPAWLRHQSAEPVPSGRDS